MKHLLLLAVVFLYYGASAQKKGQALVDSLLAEVAKTKYDTVKVWLYDDIARTYMLFDPKKKFRYKDLGLQLAEKIHWKKGIAKLNKDLGLIVEDTGNNVMARSYFQKSY